MTSVDEEIIEVRAPEPAEEPAQAAPRTPGVEVVEEGEPSHAPAAAEDGAQSAAEPAAQPAAQHSADPAAQPPAQSSAHELTMDDLDAGPMSGTQRGVLIVAGILVAVGIALLVAYWAGLFG